VEITMREGVSRRSTCITLKDAIRLRRELCIYSRSCSDPLTKTQQTQKEYTIERRRLAALEQQE